MPVYPTMSAVKKPIDLAIITIPAPLVENVLDEASEIGVKNAIVITAGFAESGPKGQVLQDQLKTKIKNLSTRVLGPNCLGAFSTITRLNATFGPKLPITGNLMLISQSGALVTGILDWATYHHTGLSHAFTLGNRIDISENDCLRFAAQDKHTKVIMIYLESFAHAPEFFSLASKVSPKKPILLLKGGRTLAGQTASASHTASLATNYTLIQALAAQTGVLLFDSFDAWLNTASLITKGSHLTGNRISIITNAGGPGVLSADDATLSHLALTNFEPQTKKRLISQLPRVHPENPLDILGDATPEMFGQAISIVAKDRRTDALAVIATPQTTTKPIKTAKAIVASSRQTKKPIVVTLMGGHTMLPALQILRQAHIPHFSYPGDAIEVLSKLNRLQELKKYITPYPTPYKIKSGPSLSPQKLSAPEGFKLLTRFGAHVPKWQVVDSITHCAAALNFVGRPAVIKTASLNIIHKAKVGAVALDIMTTHQSTVVFRRLYELYPQVIFQKTVAADLEIIIGARRDQQLGTFLVVGLGGGLTDAIADRAYVFIPAKTKTLTRAFFQTKAAAILRQKNIPSKLVIDEMERVMHIMNSHPEISEMEINPLRLTSTKAYAVDIKITLITS
jgi:acyl-CoA synthetase (NDP forming)